MKLSFTHLSWRLLKKPPAGMAFHGHHPHWHQSSASASAGGGLVQRMRGRVANAACEEHYEDDFELPDHSDDEEDAAYANDFEALSADGSDPEYASDFEAEDELNGLHEVRAQLLNEYGADGLAHAENLGVVKFLEDVQRKGASSH